MEFSNIGDFLKRFKGLEPPDQYIKDACIVVMQNVFNEELTKDDISITKGTIYLNAHPTLKNEIHIQKKTLIERINRHIGKDIIKNIL